LASEIISMVPVLTPDILDQAFEAAMSLALLRGRIELVKQRAKIDENNSAKALADSEIALAEARIAQDQAEVVRITAEAQLESARAEAYAKQLELELFRLQPRGVIEDKIVSLSCLFRSQSSSF
jgi:hypothetical protein